MYIQVYGLLKYTELECDKVVSLHVVYVVQVYRKIFSYFNKQFNNNNNNNSAVEKITGEHSLIAYPYQLSYVLCFASFEYD